ncbi:MAG: diacylglycerol kinase family protein [Usitatibacter sp.]
MAHDILDNSGRIPVILNATAGSGHDAKTHRELHELFARHGMVPDIHTARRGSEIGDQVRGAMRSDPPLIVVAGGDGTVSAVASMLRGTSTALGILPAGTLNHFARDLGIPGELERAVEVLATGTPVAVDVGEVNGRPFINNASLGLYPDIVRDRTRQQRRLGRGKYWAMLWATFGVLGRSPFLRLHLELDGRALHCVSPFVFIGNNEYVMEGFSIGTRSSVRDGRLSVYTTQRNGRFGLLRLAIRALFGRLEQADDFSSAQARQVRIESARRQLLVATDGEVTAMDTPLEFSVRPASLRVMVPRG